MSCYFILMTIYIFYFMLMPRLCSWSSHWEIQAWLRAPLHHRISARSSQGQMLCTSLQFKHSWFQNLHHPYSRSLSWATKGQAQGSSVSWQIERRPSPHHPQSRVRERKRGGKPHLGDDPKAFLLLANHSLVSSLRPLAFPVLKCQLCFWKYNFLNC